MSTYRPKDVVALLAKIPAIPARHANLTELYRRLKTLLERSPRAKLLSILKYTAYIVLLFNCGSLPFVWHSKSHFSLLSLGAFARQSVLAGHMEDIQLNMCFFL